MGEADDVSFIASLAPFIVLYPPMSTLGDQIKAFCKSKGLPCRPVSDQDSEIISDIVIFNKKDDLHYYIRTLPDATPHIVIEKETNAPEKST